MHNLIVLGSGNWVPSKDRSQPAFLLQSGQTRVLLDCGCGTIQRLLGEDLEITDITGMCITHFHADHCAELVPILDGIVMAEGKNLQRRKVLGPKGLQQRWKTLHQTFCCEELIRERIRMFEYTGHTKTCVHTFKTPGEQGYEIKVKPFEVDHILGKMCLGYACRLNNKKVVYMGDLGHEQDDWKALRRIAQGADVLIIEAGSSDASSKSHLTPERAILFADSCKAKRTILNHVSDDRLHEVWVKVQTARSKIAVELAHDGMKITL